jgi:ligand-binding sensor domain-containing protein
MRTLLLAGFLLGWVAAIAQDYSHSLRNYKAIDGLPQSHVNIMLEDKNGYLWIGTLGGGLARFRWT